MILFVLFLAGCQSKTDFGSCIGINDKKNPKVEYRYSTQNIVIGIIFSETIIVPVVVVLDSLECPIGPAVRP